MQVNTLLLKEWFALFNTKYFGGALPTPELAVGNSRTRFGTLTWRMKNKIIKKSPGDYTIRISNYYDADELQFKNVLLHEMIHLYIVSKRLKDTSPHGVIFRQQMHRINADGWHISVSAKVNGMAKSPAKRNKRPRVVLAVSMTDGKHLFSVVSPRHIKEIDRVVRHSPSVKSCSWYISSDDYFSEFPIVRTPKGRVVTSETYDRMTASMTAIFTSELDTWKQ